MSFFEQAWRRVVVPLARANNVIPCSGSCANGEGSYDDDTSATCYCCCQAPMHHRSLLQAFRESPSFTSTLPNRPLIAELGCGPFTALFALLDALQERDRSPGFRYIGIDRSKPLMSIGRGALSAVLGDAETHTFESVNALTASDLRERAEGCDGVIFLLSYVLHQPFLHRNLDPIFTWMQLVRAASTELPTWFAAQDANKKLVDEHREDWPETRLRLLADQCDNLGYTITARKKTLSSPHVRLNLDGSFRETPVTTQNVCYFFEKIA